MHGLRLPPTLHGLATPGVCFCSLQSDLCQLVPSYHDPGMRPGKGNAITSPIHPSIYTQSIREVGGVKSGCKTNPVCSPKYPLRPTLRHLFIQPVMPVGCHQQAHPPPGARLGERGGTNQEGPMPLAIISVSGYLRQAL